MSIPGLVCLHVSAKTRYTLELNANLVKMEVFNTQSLLGQPSHQSTDVLFSSGTLGVPSPNPGHSTPQLFYLYQFQTRRFCIQEKLSLRHGHYCHIYRQVLAFLHPVSTSDTLLSQRSKCMAQNQLVGKCHIRSRSFQFSFQACE